MTEELALALGAEKSKVRSMLDLVIQLAEDLGKDEEIVRMGYTSFEGPAKETRAALAEAKDDLITYIDEIIDN